MGRFIGRAKHYADPRTPAQQRANNAGGKTQDTDSSVLGSQHAALLAGGAVKFCRITLAVTAATDDGLLGEGRATIWKVSSDDGVTPVLEVLENQLVKNPFGSSFPVDQPAGVVDTGQFYILVTPPFTVATLLPHPATVVGSRANTEQALKNLLATLAAYGLIVDTTTV